MAGIVPQNSSANRTIEVKSWDFWKWELNLFIKPDALISMQLQCLPMTSLLLALGNPTVNYLSLDLEGAELEVLSCLINQHTSWLVPTTVQDARHKFQVIKTIPFDQLNIEVISVEFNLLGRLEISKMGQKRGENVLQDFSWLSCSSPLSPWPCWLLLHRNPWRWKRWGFKWWLKLLQKKTTSLLNPSCWRGNTSFRERQCLRMSGLSSPFGTLLPPICHHCKNTEKGSKRLLSLLHELSLIISQKRFNPEKSSLPLVRNLSAQMWLSFFPISWT